MAIKVNNTTVIDDDRNISSVGIATVGSGSSTITLNGATGNVNVGTGITMEGVPGNISIAGTLSALGIRFPTNITAFNPGIGQTNISVYPVQIDLTFDQIVGVGTQGTVVLRQDSPVGSIIGTIGVSGASRLSNYQIRISSNSIFLPTQTTIYPVITPNYIVSTGGFFSGINTGAGPSYSFTTRSQNTINTITPANGATGVVRTSNITLSFAYAPTRGTGTITLRTGSATGTIIESFDAASSTRISVSGNNWILDPTSELNYNTTYFLVIPNNAIAGFAGLNVAGGTSHSFTSAALQLGESFGGGRLICQSGGVRWVVASSGGEVSRNWFSISDSLVTAAAASGCTGWFVPSCGQLQNPGYVCRTYWDTYCPTLYWSSTQYNAINAFPVSMVNGGASAFYLTSNPGSRDCRTVVLCVRAFRCVTY